MLVKNIMVGKHGSVVTIEPTADLRGSKTLAERRIGVILGVDHRIICILSEREIARQPNTDEQC